MLRVVFMGTPDFSVPTLMEIVGQGHDVAAVYTQPPRPAGRGMAERRSPVHDAADALGIEVRTPAKLRDEASLSELEALEADAAVVIAYGLILPQRALDATAHGVFNVHASLLPRWRGAAPIHRAIMAGDAETGVAIMRMEAGLDTGPVAMVERVSIRAGDTTGEMTDTLARLGADLMGRALGGIERGALSLTAQPEEGVTYAHKIDKAEAVIDFSMSAPAVRAHIHGLSPWPGAHTTLPGGERLKVLRAEAVTGGGAPGTLLDSGLTVACGSGAVRLQRVQRAGKGPMAAEEFQRGAQLAAGAMLGP